MANEVFVRLTTQGTGDAAAAIKDVNLAFGQLERVVRSTGERMQQAGGVFTRAFTLPLTALGGVATKAFVDWETAMVGVAKTVDATEPQLRALGQQFVALSEEIPRSSSELANLGAVAGQLDVARENIAQFVETAAALDVSTDLGAEEAAVGLARFSNVMRTAQDQFDEMGSTLVDLGNNFAAMESEILALGQRLAGAGRQIDATEAQILGLAAGLTSVGLEAEAGGTAMSRVMVDIANAVAQGGSALRQFAEIAGQSSAEFAAQFEEDAIAAILTFVEGLGRISDEGGNVFAALESVGLANVRVRDTLLRAAGAGDLLRRAVEEGTEAWRENNALTEEAQKFYERLGAQFRTFFNQASNVAAELGESLRPEIELLLDVGRGLLDVLRGLVQAFAQLPGPIRTAIVGFTALLAAVGPVTVGLGWFLASGVTVAANVMRIAAAFKALAAAVTAGGLASLLNPVTGTVVLGLTAIAGLFLLVGRNAKRAGEEMRRAAEDAANVNDPATQRALRLGILDAERSSLATELEQITGDIESQEQRLGFASQSLIERAAELRAALKGVEAELASAGRPPRAEDPSGAGLVDRVIPPDFRRRLFERRREAREQIRALATDLAVAGQTLRSLTPGTDPFAEMAESVGDLTTALGAAETKLQSINTILSRELRQTLEEFAAAAPGILGPLAGVGPGGLPTAVAPARPTEIEGFAPVELQEQAREVARAMQQAGLSLAEVRQVGGRNFEVLRAAAARAGTSIEALVESLQGASGAVSSAAPTVIASFGAMAQAAILGSQQMAEAVIRGITQILQSVSSELSGGLFGLGTLGVPVIGALGGILGAIVAGSRRPQPVSIADVSPTAQRQLEEPDAERNVSIQIIASGTGEVLAEFEQRIRRRQSRDAILRLPPGLRLVGGT